MGTRGLTGVTIGGVDKFSYNHFDSYPSHTGLLFVSEVAEMLDQNGMERLRQKAAALQTVDETAYDVLLNNRGSLRTALARGVCLDSRAFIFDSLFCEWAWILNLDANQPRLEFYRGFQSEPHQLGRFSDRAPADKEWQEQIHGHAYYPCALWGEIPLELLGNPGFLVNLMDLLKEEPDDIERRLGELLAPFEKAAA